MHATTVPVFAFSLLAGLATADYAPFSIPYMYTKQPNGNPAGQTNFYNIEFDVNSTNGDTPQSAYCWATWGDNNNACGTGCVPYSTQAPTGSWIQCAHNSSNLYDQTSEFAFELSPQFTIGNFSVALEQTFTQTSNGTASQLIAQSNPYQISNTTSAYTCTINGAEVQYEQHANGYCSTPTGSAGFSIPFPAPSAVSACSQPVRLSFPVQERTVWGDNVFVVGNITELGAWNPYTAVALNADQYDDINTIWSGGDVAVPVGTAFEYKYIQWSADGSLLWECGENRVFTVPASACGTQTAGNNPDYFRCGNH